MGPANLDQAAQQQSRGREPAVKAANDRALRRFKDVADLDRTLAGAALLAGRACL